jgi:hypothetical protein
MEIIITIKEKESCSIIKDHVLKSLPDSTTNKKIDVSQSYGEFTVYIEDRTEPTDQTPTEE